MGFMRHHAILVTTYDFEKVGLAYGQAVKVFQSDSVSLDSTKITPADMVTPILQSPVNGYYTFAIFPDGSKEGWSESEAGNAMRATFLRYLDGQRYADGSSPLKWAEVQYGDDNHETLIVRHSDE